MILNITRHLKEPVVHVRVRWITETTKITQHALNVSAFIRLKLDAIKKMKMR